MNPKSPKIRKKKTFVRPNTNTTWCFQCFVCMRKHYKYGAHAKCYRKWCEICQDSFETEDEMKQHAMDFHKKQFCDGCNQVFTNLRVHKQNVHPK